MTVLTSVQYLASSGQRAITSLGHFFDPCFCMHIPTELGLESGPVQ